MLSLTEENYIKIIYKCGEKDGFPVSTSIIAKHLNTKSASVTAMIQKLNEKKLVQYEKYQGVSLSENGTDYALKIIRKHRIWETFLFEKLKFGKVEIHHIAEQLEHIKSDQLIDRLDDFLGNPNLDPHGDIIPKTKQKQIIQISQAHLDQWYIIIALNDSISNIIDFFDKNDIKIGQKIKIKSIYNFDNSMCIHIDNIQLDINISQIAAQNIFVSLI